MGRRSRVIGGNQRRGPGFASAVQAPGYAPLVFAVTDARVGTGHLVTQDAMAAGRRAGRYVALCGGEVLAASLTAGESGHCRSCRDRRAGR